MEEKISGDSVNEDMAAEECAPVHQSSTDLKQAQTGLLMTHPLKLIHHRRIIWDIFDFVKLFKLYSELSYLYSRSIAAESFSV